VGDQVAQPGDVCPGDLRFGLPCLGRQVLDGFPDDDELEEERIVQQGVVASRVLLTSP
jgi:hypothetical protein